MAGRPEDGAVPGVRHQSGRLSKIRAGLKDTVRVFTVISQTRKREPQEPAAAQLAEWRTLDFPSGHNLRVAGS